MCNSFKALCQLLCGCVPLCGGQWKQGIITVGEVDGTHNGPILFDMISLKHQQNEVSIMNNLKVIRTKDLLEQLNISRISLWRWSKEGKFPQPLRVNGRAFGYRVQDVEDWLDGQKK